jgi:hypothetical protein
MMSHTTLGGHRRLATAIFGLFCAVTGVTYASGLSALRLRR